MRLTLLAVLAALAFAAPAHAAITVTFKRNAASSEPRGDTFTLRRIDPRTLELGRRGLTVGTEYGRGQIEASPDGRTLALPSYTGVRFIDTRRWDFTGSDVALPAVRSVLWIAPDRLLVVGGTRAEAGPAEVHVVDPIARSVLAAYPLEHTPVAGVRVGDRYVVADVDSRDTLQRDLARLHVFDARGNRTATIPLTRLGPVGFALELRPRGGDEVLALPAYGEGRVARVALDTGAHTVWELPGHASARRWLGVRAGGREGIFEQPEDILNRPSPITFVDPDTGATKATGHDDPHPLGFGTGYLTWREEHDPKSRPRGVVARTPGGRVRWRALRRKTVSRSLGEVSVVGRQVYVPATDSFVYALDLRTGRKLARRRPTTYGDERLGDPLVVASVRGSFPRAYGEYDDNDF